MVSITCLLTVHVAIQIALVLDIYLGNGNTKQRSEGWLNTSGTSSTTIVVAVMSFFVVVDLIALSLVIQLLTLHIKLQREGLSTYQYIVRENKRRREQTRLEEDLEHRRKILIKNAIEEGGKGWYVFRLENGGFLRESCGLSFCDPLQLKQEGGGDNTNTYNNNEQEDGGTTMQNGNGYGHGFSNEEDEVDNDDDNEGGDAEESKDDSLRSDEA